MGARGARVVVIGDGARGERARPPRQAAAQAQLRVVAVQEEGFVEEADLVQHRPAVEGRGPAREQRGPAGVVLPAVRLQAAPAPVQAVGIEQVPGGVDDVAARVVEHAGRDHAHARVGLGGRDHLAREGGRGHGVVVQQQDVSAAGLADGQVVPGAEAEVAARPDQADGGAEAPLEGRVRPVARAVVHHPHLDARRILLQKALDGLLDVALPVVVDDDGAGLEGHGASSCCWSAVMASASSWSTSSREASSSSARARPRSPLLARMAARWMRGWARAGVAATAAS